MTTTPPTPTDSKPADAASTPAAADHDDPMVTQFDADKFATNMAKLMEAGGHAVANWVKARETKDVRVPSGDRMVEVSKTIGQVAEYWMADPMRMIEAQRRIAAPFFDLWSSTFKKMQGEEAAPVAEPAASDKRFADPAWKDNTAFDFLKQAFLITSSWADGLVEEARDLDPHTKAKAAFYVKQVTSALAPSNFPVTNPDVLRETLKTSGENLVRGLTMMAEDIEAGHGELKVRQTDPKAFEVGRNLAITPGKVIFRNELIELIQYTPTTASVLKKPVLFVPPWINKYYILDLTAEKSYVKWCVDQGLTVFLISWVNPDERHADRDFSDYMREGIMASLDVIREITGEESVHAAGYCVGGTLLSATLGYMAQKHDKRIASATMLTTQVDFTHAGELKLFVDEGQISALENNMRERGYLDGQWMASAFNMLRPNDLIWPYVIETYWKGKQPFPFDLLYWNSDSTRMPAANHSFYLRNCYLENKLSQGLLEMDGVRVSLKDITVPVYHLATREDHIAPARSVYEGAKMFGGPLTFVVAASGHIAGVVNPPARKKYSYWTNAATAAHPVTGLRSLTPGGKLPVRVPDSLEGWFADTTEHTGSWWPHWVSWIKAQGADMVPARVPGGGVYDALCEAPGTYVLSKA